MYIIKKDPRNSNLVLYKEELELFILPEKSFIVVEFSTKDRLFQKEYKILETFLRELANTEDFSSLSMKLHLSTSVEDITFQGVQGTSKDILTKISLPYEKDSYSLLQGLSSYKYVQDFMPKWSTAFSTVYSSHVRTFEPLFTRAVSLAYNVDNYIKSKPIQSIKNVLVYKREPEITQLSKEQVEDFKVEVPYVLNSETSLNFESKFNTIYIRLENEGSYHLRFKGSFKEGFIEEDLLVKGKGLHSLNLKYSSIYSISIIKVHAGSVINTIFISNFLEVKGFKFFKRPDKSIENIGRKIVLTDNITKNHSVFINNFPYNTGLFLDEDDNILTVYNDLIYTCKLDAKLPLDIPQNMTYNNTNYIETTYLNEDTYEISLNLGSYSSDIESTIISVSIENSLKEKYYLTEDSELVESETPIFIDSSKVKEKLILNIDIDNLVEYVIISVSDQDFKYKKSSLITQPKLEFIPNIYIQPKESLALINESYYLLNKDDNVLTPLSLNSETTSLKDTTEYSYYYLNSETFPITVEQEEVSTSVSGFSVKVYKTKSTYELNDTDKTASLGIFTLEVNSRPTIIYSKKTLEKDTFSSIGLDTFIMNTKKVIEYSKYSLDKDIFSSIGFTDFTVNSRLFPIVNYSNKEDITMKTTSFDVKVL